MRPSVFSRLISLVLIACIGCPALTPFSQAQTETEAWDESMQDAMPSAEEMASWIAPEPTPTPEPGAPAKLPACPQALPSGEAALYPDRADRLFRLVTIQNTFLGRELRKLEFLSTNSHTQLARVLGQMTPEERKTRHIELEACLRTLKKYSEELLTDDKTSPGAKMEVILNYFQRMQAVMMTRVRQGWSIERSAWRHAYSLSVPGKQLERITGFEDFLKHYPEAKAKFFRTINRDGDSVIVDRQSQNAYLSGASSMVKLEIGPSFVSSAELLGKRRFDQASFLRLFKAVMATALNFSYQSLDLYSYTEEERTPDVPDALIKEFTYFNSQAELDRQERIRSREALFRQALYQNFPKWNPKSADGLSANLFDLIQGYDNGHPKAAEIRKEYEAHKKAAAKNGNQFMTPALYAAMHKKLTGEATLTEKPATKEELIKSFRDYIAAQPEAPVQAYLQKEILEKRSRFFPFVTEMFTTGFKNSVFDLGKQAVEGIPAPMTKPSPTAPSPVPSGKPSPVPSATPSGQPSGTPEAAAPQFTPFEKEIIEVVKAIPFPTVTPPVGPNGEVYPAHPDFARMEKTATELREIVKTYLVALYKSGEVAERSRIYEKFILSEHILTPTYVAEHIDNFPLPLTDYLDGNSREELRTILRRMVARSKFVAIFVGTLVPEYSATQLETLEETLDWSVRRFEKDLYNEGFLKDAWIDGWIDASLNAITRQRKKLVEDRLEALMNDAFLVRAAIDGNPAKLPAEPKILAEALQAKWPKKVELGHITDYEVHFLNWALQSSSWAAAHEIYVASLKHIKETRAPETKSAQMFEDTGKALRLDKKWGPDESPRIEDIRYIDQDDVIKSIYADIYSKRKLYNPILSIKVGGETMAQQLYHARALRGENAIKKAYALTQQAAQVAERNYHALMTKLTQMNSLEDVKYFARTDKASFQFTEVFPEFRLILEQVTSTWEEDMTRDAMGTAYSASLFAGQAVLGLQALKGVGTLVRWGTNRAAPGVARMLSKGTLDWMIKGINYNAAGVLTASFIAMPVEGMWRSKLSRIEEANLEALSQMFTSGLDEESSITTYETILAAQGRVEKAHEADWLKSVDDVLSTTPDTRARLAIAAGSAVFLAYAAKWGRSRLELSVMNGVHKNLKIPFTMNPNAISEAATKQVREVTKAARLGQTDKDSALRQIKAIRRTRLAAYAVQADYLKKNASILRRVSPALKRDMMMDQPTLNVEALTQRYVEIQAKFKVGEITVAQMDAARRTYQNVSGIGYKMIGSNAIAVEDAINLGAESYFYRFISPQEATTIRTSQGPLTTLRENLSPTAPISPRFYFMHKTKPMTFVRQVFLEEVFSLTPLPGRTLPPHMAFHYADDFKNLGIKPTSSIDEIQKAWTKLQMQYNNALTAKTAPTAKFLEDYDRAFHSFRKLDELFDQNSLRRRAAMDARNFRWESVIDDAPGGAP